jgi:NAD-dependent DNA ligase
MEKLSKIKQKLINELTENPELAYDKKITEIVGILKASSDVYYNTDQEIMPDDVYDRVLDILKERDPTHKYFDQIGAPIRVASGKTKLPYPMGSLTKIKPEMQDDLVRWFNKYSGPYNISDKMDGVSAQLIKIDENEFKMYSRGDREYGRDISHLIPLVIKKNVGLEKIPVGTSIRGEIIISKHNFKNKTFEDMKNARAAASGIVVANKVNEKLKKLAKLCDFVAYSVIHPRYKQKQQYELLEQYGFVIPPNINKKSFTLDFLKEYITERKKISPYDVDGIVITDDEKVHNHPNGNPDHAFAFKMQFSEQMVDATIVQVLWDPSMDGYLKPRVEIKPVELVGVTITYATAFNAKFVVENKLGPDAIIKIIRSGDVIPYIMKVVKPAKKAQLPDVSYEWTTSGVDIILKNFATNDLVSVKRLVHFFKTIGAQFISEGIITKLVDNDYKTIFDILGANHQELEDIDGIGSKTVAKIFASIYDCLAEIKIHTLMAASHIFGRGLGERKIVEITKKYPNIMVDKFSKKEMLENILQINGFSDITATKFVENYDKFEKFFEKLSKLVDLSHLKNKQETKNVPKSEQIFEDKTFVFTGFRDADLEKKIINLGGKVSTSISKKTFNLIKADNDDEISSKIAAAKNNNVKIVTKTDFINKYFK